MLKVVQLVSLHKCAMSFSANLNYADNHSINNDNETMADLRPSVATPATNKRLSSPAVKFMMSPSIKSPRNTTIMTLNQSTSTPMLTPHSRGGSMVLLSPARTITESLNALATTTAQQLEETWDEVGYSSEDRAHQLTDLLNKFRDVCELKISEEQRVAETFRHSIRAAKEEIEMKSKALQIDVDPNVLQLHTSMTLSDEMEQLDATLEGLREAAATAKDKIKAYQCYLIENHAALGTEMEETWNDIESDLTTSRIEAFRREQDKVKSEVTTRTSAVVQLIRDCNQLLYDLRIDTELDPMHRQIAGSLVRGKDGSFIMTSKLASDTCIGISNGALKSLTTKVTELSCEKRRRKEKLKEMGAEIAVLWEKLRVSEEDQLAFTQSVQGLSEDTIRKGEAELKRLRNLKSEMLGKLIDEARQHIHDLWEQTNVDAKERENFSAYHESHVSDEILDECEDYVQELSSRLEQMRPILRIIERREGIVAERMEYEMLQKDPDRLQQRGAALTRQLMEEEKMAKRIKRDLPRLTESLNSKLLEWKKEHKQEFLYNGKCYLSTMEEQESQWNSYKEEEQQRKLRKKHETSYSGENQGSKMRKPHATKRSKPTTQRQPLANHN